jgi:hypothetical protein
MLVLTLMRWMSLPILAQLFCIWMYAGKLNPLPSPTLGFKCPL